MTVFPSTAGAASSVSPATDILANIGNTPLVRLKRIGAELPGIEIYGKAEFFNPGGSVKDRPALNMILDGERSGKLKPGGTILDSTSGNTGIAYAMIGAIKGYRVKLCLPENASHERKQILKNYGAEMVFSDPAESSDGAIRLCREIYEADPDQYFYPDQFNNPARHPKWREVNLSADMPGWVRFKPAAEWLAAHRNQAVSVNSAGSVDQSSPELRLAFEKFVQNYTASVGRNSLSAKERELLFEKFERFLHEAKTEVSAR